VLLDVYGQHTLLTKSLFACNLKLGNSKEVIINESTSHGNFLACSSWRT